MIINTLARSLVSLAIGVAALAGCGGSSPMARFPAGHQVLLLDGPVHLGDNRAYGQNFTTGESGGARICSLITLPQPTLAYMQIQNVRQTESLGDEVTVNKKPIRLPITLERDPRGLSSNATSASPMELVSLPAGPSEICVVAGQRPCGDLDDFELDQIVLFVQGVDENAISVRRGLTDGAPAPTRPPSIPWGVYQQPYPVAFAITPYCGIE